MAYIEDKYFSIKLTRFFMSVIGFWSFKTRREEILLNLRLTYTVLALLFAVYVQSTDVYNCWGDFNAIIYNACATMPILLVLVKISVFMIRRDAVVNLIGFTEKNFWEVSYNDYGKQIIRDCEMKGILLVFTFTSLVSGTIFNYLLAPIVENIGKNATDRVLPFNLWIDLPLTVTPYFEITYIIQSLSTIHTGICFFCFDNLLCILTIHAAGQFKILQNRLRGLCQKYSEMRNIEEFKSTTNITLQTETYCEFKSCVDQHRTLISYIKTLEHVFTFILLCQMLVSSLLMCLSGFQVFLASWNLVRRLIFISHVTACFTQLLLFTWTCNEIIEESNNVGDAVYDSEWYNVPHDKAGISLRKGLMILMVRVRRPCFLSAGKFCPMSLQAFTGILSTSVSYFTLLRQMNEEIQK